ncbi:hypothetical protein BDR06DRAFT_621128 [Suillus hirtellus]|nr:hypothetical protein BDR06DRAFT_621128 [Suillus hirtellus]
MSYSHRNEVFRNGSTLPRPVAAYAHNRIEEIYQDSDDDYNEDSSADSGEDYDEWDDREDHEA